MCYFFNNKKYKIERYRREIVTFQPQAGLLPFWPTHFGPNTSSRLRLTRINPLRRQLTSPSIQGLDLEKKKKKKKNPQPLSSGGGGKTLMALPDFCVAYLFDLPIFDKCLTSRGSRVQKYIFFQ